MSEPVIRVNKLGKCYRIGTKENGDKTFREAILDAVKAPITNFRRLRKLTNFKDANPRKSNDIIWALKDVSFEVKEGEVVGIIGRNGAGKSTLLKILTRITEPSEGHAEIRGRVSSLLEVGTGFHPELTGRENVYLNGAILGMRKWEINKKFDEIVAFAEVEKFIDTPVKRYSSGMKVRLAFAVAAHLEPEILLIDEVLAVGDVAFQKKCLGKMDEVAKKGRTVLFVSHNMGAILNLCSRVFLLDAGHFVSDGPSNAVVDEYLQRFSAFRVIPLAGRVDRKGNKRFRFLAFSLMNGDRRPISQALAGQELVIALQYNSLDGMPLRKVHVAIGIHGRFDENLFHLSTSVSGRDFDDVPPTGVLFCHMPRVPLQPGRYFFNLFATVAGEIADWIQDAGIIEVASSDAFGSGKLPQADQGPFLVEHTWQVEPDSALVEGKS